MESAASNQRLATELGNAQDASVDDLAPEIERALQQQLPRPNSPTAKDRSKRHNLFIRTAKLVGPQGEFVCVVRDVSQTGVGIRLFHEPPPGDHIELHMPEGRDYKLRQVRHDGNHVGYEFVDTIELPEFLSNNPEFPKRGLRLNLFFPVTIRTLSGVKDAIVENLSQHGARLSCDARYAIDQSLLVECPESEVSFNEVRGRVRWRRDNQYGVAFDRTLSLEAFAKLAAALQCPDLLRPDQRGSDPSAE